MDLFINYATLAALFILTFGIVTQIRKVRVLNNANSISVVEVSLRFFASSMLVIKFYSVHDWFLIVGQTIFTSVYLYYLILVIQINRRA